MRRRPTCWSASPPSCARSSRRRAGFETFGASSIDLALLFDVPGDDWNTAHPMRDRIVVSIMRRFAREGISIPYPTQTTYTAAPDGRIIMPYPEVQPVHVENTPSC